MVGLGVVAGAAGAGHCYLCASPTLTAPEWKYDKNNIIYEDGSVQKMTKIPDDLKAIYKTVWEIKQKTLVDMSVDRGCYIDTLSVCCQRLDEDGAHLFLKCKDVKELWKLASLEDACDCISVGFHLKASSYHALLPHGLHDRMLPPRASSYHALLLMVVMIVCFLGHPVIVHCFLVGILMVVMNNCFLMIFRYQVQIKQHQHCIFSRRFLENCFLVIFRYQVQIKQRQHGICSCRYVNNFKIVLFVWNNVEILEHHAALPMMFCSSLF